MNEDADAREQKKSDQLPSQTEDTAPPVVRNDSPGMSKLKGYLLKMGKFMMVMTIVGACLMLAAVWMITSTLDRIITQIGK